MTSPLHATIRRISPDQARDQAQPLAAALAEVLIDCVEGGASVSFMLPLTQQTALAFWHNVLDGVVRGERVLLVAEVPSSTAGTADTAGNAGAAGIADTASGRIVGTVQLITSQPDNQPHRADVAKMLVHRDARRSGIAGQLMAAIDSAAIAEGKTVLVLDTVTGGDAERLYGRAGWTRVGSVPNYALMPDGAYCATTFFHKQL